MQFSATQIALLIDGKVEGNADAKVAFFGKIEDATEDELAFLANPKYEEYMPHYGGEFSLRVIMHTSLIMEIYRWG